MAFPETIPRPEAVSSFDSGMAGSFTGLARDFPGPQERAGTSGAAWSLPPPGGSAIDPERQPDTSLASQSWPVLPLDTALSLQALSAALAQPVSLRPAPTDFGGISLATLAEELSARFVSSFPVPDADEGDAGDLLAIPEQPQIHAAIPATEEAPHPANDRTQREAAAKGRPSAIRAAVQSLSQAPQAVVSRQYGDVFFSDPSSTPASGEPAPSDPWVEAASKDGFLLPPLESRPDKPADTGPPQLPDWLSAGPVLPVAVAGSITPALPDKLDGASGADSCSAGQILGGAGLILMGIFLACRLPLLWLAWDADADSAWDRQKSQAGLILHGGGAMVALVLGCGSVFQRRWAVQGIIAMGWLSVLGATLVLGVAGVLLGSDVALDFDWLDTACIIAVLLVPLAYLIYYEKTTGHSPDAAPRSGSHRAPWPVPGLMILLCGLILSLAAAAMLQHQPALPLPSRQILAGPAAQAAWASLTAAGLLIAVAARCRHASAWWFLLPATLGTALTVGVCGCMGGAFWIDFLKALGCPEPAAASPSLLPLCVGLSPVILGLVLAMSRRSFTAPPSS